MFLGEVTFHRPRHLTYSRRVSTVSPFPNRNGQVPSLSRWRGSARARFRRHGNQLRSGQQPQLLGGRACAAEGAGAGLHFLGHRRTLPLPQPSPRVTGTTPLSLTAHLFPPGIVRRRRERETPGRLHPEAQLPRPNLSYAQHLFGVGWLKHGMGAKRDRQSPPSVASPFLRMAT